VHEIGEVGNQIYLSMAYTLGNKCAKNLCKRIVLLQLIIENVVTCFFGTQCIYIYIYISMFATCRIGPCGQRMTTYVAPLAHASQLPLLRH